jgi:tetratricopeptide (TPR) repeat protein
VSVENELHRDANLLAAFIDRRIDDRQTLHGVAQHLDSCEECLEIVGGTVGYARDHPPARGGAVPRWLPLSLAAAVILVAGLGGWMVWRTRSADPVAPLIQAVDLVAERPLQARLDRFGWAPLVVRRAGGERLDADLLHARAAAAELLQKTAGGATAQQQHAAGVASLISGNISSAIEHLERAVALDPSSARYWSDLSAALYERAGYDEATLTEALGAADRALSVSPELPAALFNRGLILEALGRDEDAATAYETLDRIDPGSPWTVEAVRRAKRLRERS